MYMEFMKLVSQFEQAQKDEFKVEKRKRRGRPRKETSQTIQVRRLSECESETAVDIENDSKYPLEKISCENDDDGASKNALKKFKKENKCCQITGALAVHCKIVRIIPHYGDVEHNFLMLRLDVADDFKKNRIHINPKKRVIFVTNPKDTPMKEQYSERFPTNLSAKTCEYLQKRFNSF